MLHVHNVAILGGVPAFIADLAAAFPQFVHMALHIKPQDDRGAMQMLNSAGVRVMHGPCSRAVVSGIDPAVLVLHNISGRNVEGESPWAWLREWPTISWHHSSVGSTIKTDLHIFVSQYLKGRYDNLIKSGHIKRWKVIPPCIQTSKFAKVKPSSERSLGKIATPTNAAKYPFLLLKIAERTESRLVMPGANKHYPSANGRLMSLIPSWHKVPWYLSRMRLFVYINAPTFGPETWCRGVTEALAAGVPVIGENRGGVAEQIKDRETGFLVAPDDEYLIKARVEELYDKPDLARDMGEAGRAWARENADVCTLQRELHGELLNILLDAPL